MKEHWTAFDRKQFIKYRLVTYPEGELFLSLAGLAHLVASAFDVTLEAAWIDIYSVMNERKELNNASSLGKVG